MPSCGMIYIPSFIIRCFEKVAQFRYLGKTVTNQSQTYFSTGGLPPISSSSRQAPWEPRPAINFPTELLRSYSLCNILYDERMGLSFRVAAVCRHRSHPRVRVPRDSWHYCLRFETPPTWRARFPYVYPPRTVWRSYTPRHCVPFSSPSTTRRATVEVFDPAFTQATDWLSSKPCLAYNVSTQIT
jgi:hypothetical protein